jgi:two-component system response regulator PilR (NtrC family)
VRTQSARGGERATRDGTLRAEPAELIVSDVKMPDMGGIELLRAARELLPDVALVLMTAFATVETAREAFKLGADDFIQKPFDIDELKLIVVKALENKRSSRRIRRSSARSMIAASSATLSGAASVCRPFTR